MSKDTGVDVLLEGPKPSCAGFPSQKHSNALKKVKSWRGLSEGPNKKIEGPNKKIRRTYVSKEENFEILFGIPFFRLNQTRKPNEKPERTLANRGILHFRFLRFGFDFCVSISISRLTPQTRFKTASIESAGPVSADFQQKRVLRASLRSSKFPADFQQFLRLSIRLRDVNMYKRNQDFSEMLYRVATSPDR